MAEILAPAGSFESVEAACRCGANAVYLGAKSFSARASAQNFSLQELYKTVSFCHERDVKVYLTLNTSIFDKEMSDAAKLIEDSAKLGIDALIVSDLGIVSLAKEICPSMPLHASTQICIQSAEGVLQAKKLGFERAVLAREMSREEICDAVKNGGIETEVFVHGALCMCVSGQCYLSSVLGARSGNRGRCAQPCRLDFSCGSSHYALSLKDLSLNRHLTELDSIGVSSFKIEGRMKRPEYVAAAVSLVRAGLSGAQNKELLELSQDIFSRSGFTEAYYLGKVDKKIFGFRSKDDIESSKDAIPKLHELYRRETPIVPINAKLTVKQNIQTELCLCDEKNNSVSVKADAPDKANNTALTKSDALEKISRLGSTPYFIKNFEADIDDDAFVSASVLNNMRREAVQRLSEIRGEIKPLATFKPREEKDVLKKYERQKKYARAEKIEQLIGIEGMLDKIIIPYREILNNPVKELLPKLCAELDRFAFSNDERTKNALFRLKQIGITSVCVQNPSQIAVSKELGFEIMYGPFMNIYNSRSLEMLKEEGISEAVASFELSSKAIKYLKPHIDIGALAYGYIPLMMTRACPVKNIKGCSECGQNGGVLKDRTGREMLVKCRGTVSEIYNCVPLCANLSNGDFDSLSFLLYYFTIENSNQIKSILTAKEPVKVNSFTRGLYKSGVI